MEHTFNILSKYLWFNIFCFFRYFSNKSMFFLLLLFACHFRFDCGRTHIMAPDRTKKKELINYFRLVWFSKQGNIYSKKTTTLNCMLSCSRQHFSLINTEQRRQTREEKWLPITFRLYFSTWFCVRCLYKQIFDNQWSIKKCLVYANQIHKIYRK